MTRLVFILTLFLLVSSCAKHLDKDQDNPAKMRFGVLVPDTTVRLSDNNPVFKPAVDVNAINDLKISSRDWLALANQLMETGAVLSGDAHDRLLQAGHNLSESFYNYPNDHTLMTGTSHPVGSPWAEAAAFFGQPVLEKDLSDSIDGVEAKVAAAVPSANVSVSDLGPLPLPEDLVQRVIDGLQNFRAALVTQRDGTGDAILDQITTEVDQKYLQDLETLRDSVRMDRTQPLITSLKSLETILAKMTEIDDLEKKRLLIAIREGEKLALRSESLKDSSGALHLLIDVWLAADTRAVMPASVKKIFATLTDNEILALATQNKTQIFSDDQWGGFKSRTDYSVVPDAQMVAIYLNNNGNIIPQADWDNLQKGAGAELQKIINNPDVQEFITDYSVAYPVAPGDDALVLANQWLNLSARIAFPAEVKKAFSLYENKDLEDLRTDMPYVNGTTFLAVSGHEELAIARFKMLSGIESFGAKDGQSISSKQGLQNFKDFFDAGIVSATRNRVDSAMLPIAQELPQKLSDSILPDLEAQKKNIHQTAADTFRIYSRYYVGKLIFGADITKGSLTDDLEAADNEIIDSDPLPLLEKTNLSLVRTSGHFQDQPTNDVTSATVLGLGLVNNLDRLQTLQQYENIPPDGRGATALTYEIISKLLALGGYRDLNSNLVASLAESMTAGHEGERLDIKAYDPHQVVFATPDVVRLQNQFRLDPASAQGAKVGVTGQMELLHAYANLLGYFKPWEASSFDLGLGALRVEEDPTFQVFDRGDYFLLSLGLSSIILKNIPVKMLGLITDQNKFVESASVPDPDEVSAIGAVLGDYTREAMSHQISVAAMSHGILALSEFFEQIEDLEKTTNPTILDALKQEPLDGARSDLQKLISGLVIFCTGHLMQADGGFVSAYDGDKNQLSSGPRLLRDQILMEQALLKAGSVFGSDFMKAKAVENFFFLNGHFWNPNLGFYTEEENSSSSKVRLYDVTLELQNLEELKQELPQLMTQGPNLKASLDQMGQLEQLWQKRFLTNLLDLPPIEQIFEFSL